MILYVCEKAPSGGRMGAILGPGIDVCPYCRRPLVEHEIHEGPDSKPSVRSLGDTAPRD